MNSLSWFLYLASILPQLQAATILCAVVLVILFLFTCMDRDTKAGFYGEWKAPKWQLPTAAILILVAVLVPSTQTIYLIAGSEAGEAVVTSNEGRAILNDIQEVIRAQLGNLKQ